MTRRLMLSARSANRGGLLIEVLVAVLICAFGLLGFASMQARATTSEFESFQRSQALQLVADMANRMNANRANAGAYVVNGLIGGGALADCSALLGAPRDLCEWSNLLSGSTELRGSSAIGSMFGARGCIVRAAGSSDRYVVSVAWQGVLSTGAPADPCGQGDPAFPAEPLRRTVSATVCIALLRDPASAPALSRC